MKDMIFQDRRDAGRRLAGRLAEYAGPGTIVMALPRGGVPVGYEIAVALHAPLDVIIARKLGAPGQPEYGIGAVAPGGIRILDDYAVRVMGITAREVEELTAAERAEMERRIRLYRRNRPAAEIGGKQVLLVDDGLATGVTAEAAAVSLRLQKPQSIVLAVPVCAPEASKRLASKVDDLVCLSAPADFIAVGAWYVSFPQVQDDEVMELLDRAARERKE